MPKCPKCGAVLRHDTFEDCYGCLPCNTFFYPSEVGRAEDPAAGYLTLPSVPQKPTPEEIRLRDLMRDKELKAALLADADALRDAFFRVLNLDQRVGNETI